MQIDSLIARGVISPGAAERLFQRVADPSSRDRSQPPALGPEMGRGGGRAGASGEKVMAPDYGAESTPPKGAGNVAGMSESSYRGPPVVYHETDAYNGGDLLPLSARHGNRESAVQEFMRRWPLVTRRQALKDVDLVWTTDSESGRGQGNKVLAIDARKVPDLEWFMHPEETDGGWVTDRIPAEAILGHADDPKVIAKVKAIEESQ